LLNYGLHEAAQLEPWLHEGGGVAARDGLEGLPAGCGGGGLQTEAQFTDSAQSVSANVAEGYGRRTRPEYLQFLYTAKGSLAEALTRGCGLWRVQLISNADFESFDQLHYEVENKLLALITSIEAKCGTGDWQDSLPTDPSIH
jgi:four helix bundle protein